MDGVAPGFAELLGRSCFSFLEGASHPDELVRRAKDLDLSALAICDRDGLYGVVRAHAEGKTAGQRVLVGAELTLEGAPGTVALVAADHEGYSCLCRLLTAAHLAGFRDVNFFYEPVGACVEYAVASDEQQRLMVVDIGGGTCDVCIMEFGGGHGPAQRLAESRILAVSGVPVAGDAIDREIIRSKLFPVFGSRARYGPNKLPMPQFVYNQILDWQNLYKLNTEETINWLLAAECSSDHPEGLRALRFLIQRNFGYPIVREVEAAKKRLSQSMETEISLHYMDIHLDERLERGEFSHIIEDQLQVMLGTIEEAESAAGLRPDQLDLVLTTGGTSLIPAIRDGSKLSATISRL